MPQAHYYALTCLSLTIALATANQAAAKNIFDDDWTPPKPAEAPRSKPAHKPADPPAVVPTPPTPADTANVAPPTPAPIAPTPPARLAVPARPEQAAVRKVMKEVFAEQLIDRSIKGRRKLADSLLAQADKSAEVPAERFVLLAASIDAGVEGASLPVAFRAADSLGREFDVDALTMKAVAVSALEARSVPAESSAETVLAGLELARNLASAGDFTNAARVCTSMNAIPGDKAQRDAIQQFAKSIEAEREVAATAAKALEKLKASPEDPAANLTAGLHACLYLGDWDPGLYMLTKCADPAIRDLAAREMAIRKDAAKSVAASDKDRLGDVWWEVADREKTAATKSRMAARAAYWYESALPELVGLNKAKAEKRMASVGAAAGSGAAVAGAGKVPAAGGNPKANSGLAPGLVMLEYARDKSQEKPAYVDPDHLGKPVSAPQVVTTLDWKYDEKHNAVASGYLRIDKAGDYVFNSNSFYDRNALYVNGKLVCPYRDGETKTATIALEAGYVPIQSVGSTDARGTVRVKWTRPGDRGLSDVPAEVLFHSTQGSSGAPVAVARPAVGSGGATGAATGGPARGGVGGAGRLDETIGITARKEVGYDVGKIAKGEKLILQYVSGKWKSWGHIAGESPDGTGEKMPESCRVAICELTPDAGAKVLAIVPGGTKQTPFAWAAERDYADLVLRINDSDGDFANNPEKDVKYHLQVLREK